MDKQFLVPSLDALAVGLVEFEEIAAANKFAGFSKFIKIAFQILELSRASMFNQIEKEKIYGKTAKDIFYATFESNMNALYIASMATKNGYVKNQIKTPMEKYTKIAVDLIAEFVHVGKIVKNSR